MNQRTPQNQPQIPPPVEAVAILQSAGPMILSALSQLLLVSRHFEREETVTIAFTATPPKADGGGFGQQVVVLEASTYKKADIEAAVEAMRRRLEGDGVAMPN